MSRVKRQVVALFIIALTLFAAKSAILALYIRLFGTVTWMRKISWTCIILIAIFYTMNMIVVGAYCVPERGHEVETVERCASGAWLSVAVGVFATVADLVMLILPFPILMKLQISMTEKITLGLVFGTGILSVALHLLNTQVLMPIP